MPKSASPPVTAASTALALPSSSCTRTPGKRAANGRSTAGSTCVASVGTQATRTWPRRSGNRVLIDQVLAELPARPAVFHEAEHVAGALALVEAGLGLAALPRLGVPARHATLAAVRLVEPVVERVLGLVTPVDRPLPPAAAALHDLLATALPGRWLTPIAPSAAPARTPAR